MHVLSVSSLKGGVGKTTVTLGLASAAFAKGLRTLVVDLDPQSDVSTGMDIQVAGHLNVADVLASPKEKIVRAAIAPSGWTKGRTGKIDVMIGSPSAINFDGPHPSIRDIWKLEEALANVEHDYELVLIDCAPSLNALTRTAWAASDRVAVVTEPGLFSVAAADRALRAIEEIRRGLSPRLQPLGIIVNRARVQSLEHQFRIKELRDMFGPLVLSPQLPERTSLQQAQGAAKPLHVWPGESAQEMAHNFDLLLERVLRTARIGEYATAGSYPPAAEHTSRRAREMGTRTPAQGTTLPVLGGGARRVRGSGGLGLGGAAGGELVEGVGLGVQLDEGGLDLAEDLADGDAEDALAAADEVDDLVVGGAQVDARAVAHERGLGEVVDARLAQLVDRGADLLEGDAGVEEALDELEDEDVAEAVEALRAGAGRAAHGRLDEAGARPVVELAVGDPGRARRDGAAVAVRVVQLGETVGEQQTEVVPGHAAVTTQFAHAVRLSPGSGMLRR